MAKGVSIKFTSYNETISKLLSITGFANELAKHPNIILKPSLNENSADNTSIDLVESILAFIRDNVPRSTRVYIAEGSEGQETNHLFEDHGYKKLAEKYQVSLIDLNNTEFIEIRNPDFLKTESIIYPKILMDGLIISLSKLSDHPELQVSTSVSNMIGAFPARHYKSWFSRNKNKIRKDPLEYAVHDIIKCKMPEVAIIDASDYGRIFLGDPFEVDKKALETVKGSWQDIEHLNLIHNSLNPVQENLSEEEKILSQIEIK